MQANSALKVQGQRLPGTDGREPELVGFVLQFMQEPPAEPFRVVNSPQPDMGVEQQPQSRSASHSSSSSSFAGEMISPTISMESFIEPIQAARPWIDEGGMTSAMGFTNRVTRIGFFVFETCSSSARHLALNFEMAISCMFRALTTILHHGHNIWSIAKTTFADRV